MELAPVKRRSHWPIVILSTFSTAFGVLLPLILVRLISAEEVGKFRIFFLYLALGPAFSLTAGIINGLAYWAGQEREKERAFKFSSSLIILIALFILTVALAARHYIAKTFEWTEVQSILFALSLFGTIAAPFFEEAAIASGRIWTGALFYSGFEMLRAIAILFALIYYRSLTAVFLAHTLTVLLKLSAGYIYGYYLGLVGLIYDRDIRKSVWKYAFPVSLACAFGIFVSTADQFILAPRIPAAEFALYSIGCLSIAPILIFEHSITRVLIPQMSEASSKRQKSHIAVLYQSAVENLSFILIPSVVGLILFANPIIEIFFTQHYAEAAHYLRLYALSYLLLVIPYDALPRSKGQSNWILRTFMVFAFFSLTLAYLLSVAFGPTGAVCAVLISGAMLRVYAIYYFRKESGLSLGQFLPLTSFAQYLLLSLTLAALALMLKAEFENPHLWFFITGAAFAFLYLLLALPLKNKSEKARNPLRGLLFITQSLNIGGLERMVLNLCEQIKNENKWDVRVIAYDQSYDSMNLIADFQSKEIPVEAFKKPGRFSFMVVLRILKTVYRNDIQIIHSHDLGGLIYAVIAKILSFGRISIVHTQHSFIHLSNNPKYRQYEKLLSLGIDRLSVVSEDTRKTYLELGISDQKIHLIENGVEFNSNQLHSRAERVAQRSSLLSELPENLARSVKHHLNDYWLLYLARFCPGKGQEHALRLWESLQSDLRLKSVLCFIGPESYEGEYQRIKKIAENSAEKDRILFLGGSSQPQRWMAAGDLFLSCSEFEGMPLGPLEAAGSGIPLLLSQIPGHSFLDSVSLQYPPENSFLGAKRLKEIIDQIESDELNYLKNLWQEGCPLRERFSIKEMARKYSLLYSSSTAREVNFFQPLEKLLPRWNPRSS